LCQVHVMCFAISIFILRTVSLIALRRTHVSGENIYIYIYIFMYVCVPGSSVSIATELQAGRSGIESRWGRDFPPVQTGLREPTQPPVKQVLGLSRG